MFRRYSGDEIVIQDMYSEAFEAGRAAERAEWNKTAPLSEWQKMEATIEKQATEIERLNYQIEKLHEKSGIVELSLAQMDAINERQAALIRECKSALTCYEDEPDGNHLPAARALAAIEEYEREQT